MNRKRGLGSGLDALIPSGSSESTMVRDIDVDAIRENRKQPRTRFDEQELEELTASIREHGLIQPLIVAELPEGGYELIAGERRWRAARRAGLESVPVILKEATPQQLLELALVENVQRADLNSLEEGRAYQTLKDEFHLTDEQIAQRVGKSRVAIVNARRLIRLISDAQQALLDESISAGHGRALLRLEQPDQQASALALILRRDLSVRESERLVDLVLNTLAASSLQQALLMGAVTAAQAQALLRLEDAAQQGNALDVTLAEGFGDSETERLCDLIADGLECDQALDRIRGRNQSVAPSLSASRDHAKTHDEARKPAARTSPEDEAIQRQFEETLGTPVVVIRHNNAIKVTITLYDDDQLSSFYDLVVGGIR